MQLSILPLVLLWWLLVHFKSTKQNLVHQIDWYITTISLNEIYSCKICRHQYAIP